jgi:hypothetical protein
MLPPSSTKRAEPGLGRPAPLAHSGVTAV